MSKLLNAIHFFEEEIPVRVFEEFDPKDAKFLSQALKLGTTLSPQPRKRGLLQIVSDILVVFSFASFALTSLTC